MSPLASPVTTSWFPSGTANHTSNHTTQGEKTAWQQLQKGFEQQDLERGSLTHGGTKASVLEDVHERASIRNCLASLSCVPLPVEQFVQFEHR